MDGFGALELNKRTLHAQQAALQTSQQNVSNANTPGYHRQRAIMTSTPGMLVSGLAGMGRKALLGTGTQVSQITRIRDYFVDKQVALTKQKLGELTEEQNGLERIEIIFNELTKNVDLNNSMAEFWNSWETLAQDPGNLAFRIDLKGKAVGMAQDLNRLYTELEELQPNFGEDIRIKVSRLNSLTKQLARLNRDILRVEAQIAPDFSRVEANELRDQRDLLISKISELTDVKIVNMKNGTVNLYIDGKLIVQDFSAYELEVVPRTEEEVAVPGQVLVDVMISRYSELEDREITIRNGEIGGLLDLQDEIIPHYLERLDELAVTIMREINELHKSGIGLDGSTNTRFFVYTPGGTTDERDGTDIQSRQDTSRAAATMRVSDEILQDLDKIAAAKTYARGDNSNAQEIAGLRDKLFFAGDALTFDAFYNSVVTSLGSQTEETGRLVQSAEAVLDQLVNKRESISGVSLDEELINMVQFQHVFEAAARITTTVDGMLETVINRMGLVGR